MSSSSRVILDQTQLSTAKKAVTVLKLNYREAVQHFAIRNQDQGAIKATEAVFTKELNFNEIHQIAMLDIERTPFMGDTKEAVRYYSEWLSPIISNCYSQGDFFGGSFAGNLVSFLSTNKIIRFGGMDESDSLKKGKGNFAFAFFNDLGEKCGFTIEYSKSDPSAWVISVASNIDSPLLEDRSVTLIYSPFFKEKSDVAFQSKMTQTTDPKELRKIIDDAVNSKQASAILAPIFTPELKVDYTKLSSKHIQQNGKSSLETLNQLTRSLEINHHLSRLQIAISKNHVEDAKHRISLALRDLPSEEKLTGTTTDQLILKLRGSLKILASTLNTDLPSTNLLKDQFEVIEFYFERVQLSKKIEKNLEKENNPFPEEHSFYTLYNNLYSTAKNMFASLLNDKNSKASELILAQRLLARAELILKNPEENMNQFEQEIMAIINNDRIDNSFKEALLKISQNSHLHEAWKKENLSESPDKPEASNITLLDQEIKFPPLPHSPLYKARLQYVYELKESLHKMNDTKKEIKTLQSTMTSLKDFLKTPKLEKDVIIAKNKELQDTIAQLNRAIGTIDQCYKTMQSCQDKLLQSREIMNQVIVFATSPPPVISPFRQSCETLYKEVEKETVHLMEDRYALEEDFTLLSKTLKNADKVIKNPTDYRDLAADATEMNQRIGKRKLAGAILMLLGAAIMAAGVLGAFYSFGVSVPLGFKIGGAIFSVGVGYYMGKSSVEFLKNAKERTTRTGVAKTASELAKSAKLKTPSQVNLDNKDINLDSIIPNKPK